MGKLKEVEILKTVSIQHEFRINQVLDFIENHLEDVISLDCLAERAHFSRYHFLRLFQERMGEAPYSYLRRRRLEIGASQLLYSGESVAAIASTCGFETADGFSRAFRQYFGLAPAPWREKRYADTANMVTKTLDTRGWTARILTIPTVRVAYLRHVGPYNQSNGEQWERMSAWMRTNQIPGGWRYGMGLDDPGLTAPAKCRYDACVEVPENFALPPRTPVKTIKGGVHAVMRYVGPRSESHHAWLWLMREGIPLGRYKPAPRSVFERYDVHVADPGAEIEDCELCVPLQARGGI